MNQGLTRQIQPTLVPCAADLHVYSCGTGRLENREAIELADKIARNFVELM